MKSPRPLFFVGNKRSGTTLLVNMLNEHPGVAVTHESDIVWALYQCRHGVPDHFATFPEDAPRGLEATIAAYLDHLRDLFGTTPTSADLRAAFFAMQRCVVEQGTSIHPSLKSATQLAYLGDKKPVQHCSPDIFAFIGEVFPDARFVHLIRHPQGTVGSKLVAARTWPVVPTYWKASANDVLDRWCTHEESVLSIKQQCPGRVHSLRLEDLVKCPAEEMERLFAFLELEMATPLRHRMVEFVYCDPNAKYASVHLPYSARLRSILNQYSYCSVMAEPATPALG